MSLEFFGHPFSSYTQKVLIALWSDETPFDYRMLDQDHPENFEELKRHSPFGLFPLLLDGGRPVIETTCIIEHLQTHLRRGGTAGRAEARGKLRFEQGRRLRDL